MRVRVVLLPGEPIAVSPATEDLSTSGTPTDAEVEPVAPPPAPPAVETPVSDLNVRFNEVVTVRRTWARRDYDRKGEVTWRLTPEKAMEIRNELNTFKREMTIHEDSKHNKHYY